MMQASKVTFPSRSGRPPLPTVSLLISASSTMTPCSTASRELPPASSTSQAFALAFIKFQVQTTRGRSCFVGAFGRGIGPCSPFPILHEAKAVTVAKPAAPRPEFFRNLRRSMERLINFKGLNIGYVVGNLRQFPGIGPERPAGRGGPYRDLRRTRGGGHQPLPGDPDQPERAAGYSHPCAAAAAFRTFCLFGAGIRGDQGGCP